MNLSVLSATLGLLTTLSSCCYLPLVDGQRLRHDQFLLSAQNRDSLYHLQDMQGRSLAMGARLWVPSCRPSSPPHFTLVVDLFTLRVGDSLVFDNTGIGFMARWPSDSSSIQVDIGARISVASLRPESYKHRIKIRAKRSSDTVNHSPADLLPGSLVMTFIPENRQRKLGLPHHFEVNFTRVADLAHLGKLKFMLLIE
jgi:hypothetical protein